MRYHRHDGSGGPALGTPLPHSQCYKHVRTGGCTSEIRFRHVPRGWQARGCALSVLPLPALTGRRHTPRVMRPQNRGTMNLSLGDAMMTSNRLESCLITDSISMRTSVLQMHQPRPSPSVTSIGAVTLARWCAAPCGGGILPHRPPVPPVPYVTPPAERPGWIDISSAQGHCASGLASRPRSEDSGPLSSRLDLRWGELGDRGARPPQSRPTFRERRTSCRKPLSCEVSRCVVRRRQSWLGTRSAVRTKGSALRVSRAGGLPA